MRRALHERRVPIEQRAEACLDTALTNAKSWLTTLGTPPTGPQESAAWRECATMVAAYRDRYGIMIPTALGTVESPRQKIDEARARNTYG